MGLANDVAPREWQVRRDFETVLKAMQRTSDRQKMLASHGALLSDERLPLVVLDLRKLKTLEGRVLAHGEEETGKARRPALPVAGRHRRESAPDLLHAGNGRGAEQRKTPRKLVRRLQKQFENGRPVLEIEDSGDAERILHNKRHFGERASGIAPLEGAWGGWLGRYHAALSKAETDQMKLTADRQASRDR